MVSSPRSRWGRRSEEHTSELQSRGHLVCRLLLPLPPSSPLFPYTTLFRSHLHRAPRGPQPQCPVRHGAGRRRGRDPRGDRGGHPAGAVPAGRQRRRAQQPRWSVRRGRGGAGDRKSTRLNSSHVAISYAVFCFLSHPALRSFPTRRSSDLTFTGPRGARNRNVLFAMGLGVGAAVILGVIVAVTLLVLFPQGGSAGAPSSLDGQFAEVEVGQEIGRAHV